MKKMLGFLAVFAGLALSVFAQNEQENALRKKHIALDNYFGPSVGIAAMKLNDGMIFTADLGVSYDFYALDWLSLNAGIFFHQEIYDRQPSDDRRMVPKGNPFCFTIPLGIHINIPRIEWLYTGFYFAFNIPILDISAPAERNAYSSSDLFFSLPIDIGFDMIQPGKGGSRLLFRITPSFHKGGTALPIGIVWQIYNWRIFAKKVEVNVPQVKVNVPPPTVRSTIIIIQ